jgi:Protein of unknown function (Hypoth_ymh)
LARRARFLLPDPQYIDRGAGPRVLSRRAARLARDPDPRLALGARRLHKDALHPTIREDVWALYHRGKYDTAVFEAMKAVEVAVREAAGLAAKDIGYSLMRTAFGRRHRKHHAGWIETTLCQNVVDEIAVRVNLILLTLTRARFSLIVFSSPYAKAKLPIEIDEIGSGPFEGLAAVGPFLDSE